MKIHKGYFDCTSAVSLNSQCPGSGIKVENPASLNS